MRDVVVADNYWKETGKNGWISWKIASRILFVLYLKINSRVYIYIYSKSTALVALMTVFLYARRIITKAAILLLTGNRIYSPFSYYIQLHLLFSIFSFLLILFLGRCHLEGRNEFSLMEYSNFYCHI